MRDETESPDARRAMAGLLNIERRFPSLPFQPSPGSSVLVCQFDVAIASSFMADVVGQLLRACDDSSIDLVVLEPPGRGYRLDADGAVGSATRTERVVRDLFDAIEIEEDEFGGTISALAEVLVIAGSSARWVLWAERDWEIAVLLAPRKMKHVLISTGLFFQPSDDFVGALTPVGFPRFLSDDELRAFRDSVRAVTR